MVARCRPLIEVLAELPDVRKARGKRHALTAILALVCVATLCGYRSYGAIAQWARVYPAKLVRALGFTHRTPPCAATLHTVLRSLDRTQVEARLGSWAEAVLAQVPPAEPPEDEAIAIDGKALRGSRQQGAPQAFRHHALAGPRHVGHVLGVGLETHGADAEVDVQHVAGQDDRARAQRGWIGHAAALHVVQAIEDLGFDRQGLTCTRSAA